MSISTIQNFYKETITRAVTLTGATNIYVSALPTPDEGYIVISPSSSSLREIVYYTAKGTDSNGTYLTVTLANRGLGGTTAQTHAIGEPVRMNVTAEHIKEISDALDQIVAGGTQDASTTSKGITKLSVAPASASNPIAVGDNDPRVPTTDENDAMAGGGDLGTPSSSNKFQTEKGTSVLTKLLSKDVVGVTLNASSEGTIEKTLVSQSIPGGYLGSDKAVRIRGKFKDMWYSGSPTITFRVKYGSTTLISKVITSYPDLSSGDFEIILFAGASASAQTAVLSLIFYKENVISQYSYNPGTATEDSSGDLTLSMTAQYSQATNSRITANYITIEKL